MAENESLENSSSNIQHDKHEEEEDDDATPANSSDEDNEDVEQASVDSISTNKMDEIERRATVLEHSILQQKQSRIEVTAEDRDDTKEKSESLNPFADNFDDVADQVVNKYANMTPSPQPPATDDEANHSHSDKLDILGVEPQSKLIYIQLVLSLHNALIICIWYDVSMRYIQCTKW